MAFHYVCENNKDQASGKLVNGLLQINHNSAISHDFEYQKDCYINYDQSYSSSAVTGTTELDELVSLLINDDLPIRINHCRSSSNHEEEDSAAQTLAEDSPAEASIHFNPVVVSRNFENENPNIHVNCESFTADNYEQLNPHTHDDDHCHHHHYDPVSSSPSPSPTINLSHDDHYHHHYDPVSSSPSPSPSPAINLSHDEKHSNSMMSMHSNHHHYHAAMAQVPLPVVPLYNNDGVVTLSFAQQPSPSPSPSPLPYETSNCSFTASSFGSYHNIASPLDVSSSPIGTSKKRKATKSALNDCFKDHHERIGIIVQTNNLQLPDGYIWRKYGQKMIKHEEHPRSYHKCAQDGCKVKKHTQMQSRSEIMFTYEGKHNHAAPNL